MLENVAVVAGMKGVPVVHVKPIAAHAGAVNSLPPLTIR